MAQRPDLLALSVQPGHCGSCARWTATPDMGARQGECNAPTRLWWPDAAPLSIDAAHACPINSYRSALSGKTYGPRPLALQGQG
ncbi:hypothetical protein [Deinococcus sp.]|uniref:hypothetical protein n=1 Tax=Deinococcus sp. TaxID=47478 RepID=UPI003B5B4A5C